MNAPFFVRDNINKRIPRKYFGIFNKIIVDTISNKNITHHQFGEMIAQAYTERYDDFDITLIPSKRNNLIKTIVGLNCLGVNRFKFIMEEVLKEPIPDDPEISQLIMIGIGDDLRGQQFGRLIPFECIGAIGNNGYLYWKCLCSNIIDGVEKCGKEVVITSSSLVSKNTTSCGCYRIENVIELSTSHGKANTSEYRIWHNMLQRCTNHNNTDYHNYGGRGISVCDQWKDFANFYIDMGDRPEGLTLDRIDNDGNYEPGNCHWATASEQALNKCNTIKFDDGTSAVLWARENAIAERAVKIECKAGKTKEEILDKYSSERKKLILA